MTRTTDHRSAEPPRRRPRRGALLAALCALAACKPAEEPPRNASVADAGPTGVVRTVDPVGAPPGAVLVAPLPETGAPPPTIGEVGDPVDDTGALPDVVVGADDDATTGTDASAQADVDDAVAEDVDAEGALGADELGGVELPPELVARVRAPVDDRDEARARSLNASGLRKHRRYDLDAAILDYRRALNHWPGHLFSNYNLACAYALKRLPDDAVRHLAIIAAIGGSDAEERLLSARSDEDFETMRDDPRFRALAGYVPVRVTWSPAAASERSTAVRLANALRDAKIPARSDASPWSANEPRPTLLVREGDPAAADMAREVARIVRLDDLQTRTSPLATLDAPVILVLPGEPTEVAVTTEVAAKTISDYLGKKLTARDTDGTLSTLQLKDTGFFDWIRSEPDGRRVERKGRYTIRGDTLALDFKEIVEGAPGADPTARALETREGLQATHRLRATDEGLEVDGLRFAPGGG